MSHKFHGLISDLYALSTPYEEPMRAGLGSLHWRYTCEATCRKCGKMVKQTAGFRRQWWDKVLDRPIPATRPTEEQVITGIMLLVHNNNVGREKSHDADCPVGFMHKGKFLLNGVETNALGGYSGRPS